jgi:hypothetical protein
MQTGPYTLSGEKKRKTRNQRGRGQEKGKGALGVSFLDRSIMDQSSI